MRLEPNPFVGGVYFTACHELNELSSILLFVIHVIRHIKFFVESITSGEGYDSLCIILIVCISNVISLYVISNLTSTETSHPWAAWFVL